VADSRLIAGRKLDSAGEVARAGYTAMKKGRPYVVTGTTSKLFAFGSRFLPRTVSASIAGRSQQRLIDRDVSSG
jgi:short-subunit dehydrogenase